MRSEDNDALIETAKQCGVRAGVTVRSRINLHEFRIKDEWMFNVEGNVLWIGPLVLHSHRGWGVDVIIDA